MSDTIQYVRKVSTGTRDMIVITEPSGQAGLRNINCSIEDAIIIYEQLEHELREHLNTAE